MSAHLLRVCVHGGAPAALCSNVNTRSIKSIKKRGCWKGEGSASVVAQTAKLNMRFGVDPPHKAKRAHADRRAVQSGACEAVVSLNVLMKPSPGLNQDQVNPSSVFTHLYPLLRRPSTSLSWNQNINKASHDICSKQSGHFCGAQLSHDVWIRSPMPVVLIDLWEVFEHYTSNGLLDLPTGKKKKHTTHARCPLWLKPDAEKHSSVNTFLLMELKRLGKHTSEAYAGRVFYSTNANGRGARMQTNTITTAEMILWLREANAQTSKAFQNSIVLKTTSLRRQGRHCQQINSFRPQASSPTTSAELWLGVIKNKEINVHELCDLGARIENWQNVHGAGNIKNARK